MIINDVIFNVELQDILDELVAELRANGSQLIQRQKNGPEHIQICCPYHNNGMERRPSAGIRKSDGMFHCFACGEVHTLPEVISHCFGQDDAVGKFGWQWLLKNFSIVKVGERKDVELDLSRSGLYSNVTSNRGNIDRDNYNFVTEEELKKYRYIHPYMYERKLTDDVIELFDIGFDSNTQCITFPVRDINGNCLFVARRSVKTKYFSYPKGVEKPLYGLYEIELSSYVIRAYKQLDGSIKFESGYPKEIIVCESMLDALTCWVYGKYAVALNGLGNELQFKQLRDLPCRKLILATDNDDAGQSARKRIRENLQNRKIISEYILPTNRKDINELSKEEFENLLEIF